MGIFESDFDCLTEKCSESPPAASPSPPPRTWTPSRPFLSTRSASTLPSQLPPVAQSALVLSSRYENRVRDWILSISHFFLSFCHFLLETVFLGFCFKTQCFTLDEIHRSHNCGLICVCTVQSDSKSS